MKRIIILAIQWYKRRKGVPVVDYEKGAGYYLPIGLFNAKLKGREEVWKMESGKKMVVRLIDYDSYLDPKDMVKNSKWQFIGYEGEKPFSEMGLIEWIKYAK